MATTTTTTVACQTNYTQTLLSDTCHNYSEWDLSLFRRIIFASNFSVQSFLSELSIQPGFQEILSKKTDQSTVLTQILLLLEEAEKKKDLTEKEFSPAITWNEFMIFITLNTIEDVIAKETISLTNNIRYRYDSIELKQKMTHDIFSKLGMGDEKIKIFTSLSCDCMDLLINDEIDSREALNKIIDMSKMANISVAKFSILYLSFHYIVKNSSYESLTIDQTNKLEALIGKLKTIFHCEAVFIQLQNMIDHKESIIKLRSFFIENSDSLYMYLMIMHKELLSENYSKERYNGVFKTFRKLFLIFADFAGYDLQKYKSELDKQLVNQQRYVTDNYFESLLAMKYLSFTNSGKNSPLMIIDSLINFRKDYLMKYKSEKVFELFKQNYSGLPIDAYTYQDPLSSYNSEMLYNTQTPTCYFIRLFIWR